MPEELTTTEQDSIPGQLDRADATPEVMSNSAELDAKILPAYEQLSELYRLELNAQETPPARLALPGEVPNTDLILSEGQTPESGLSDVEGIREDYTNNTIRRELNATWWIRLSILLKGFGLDTEQADRLKVNAKHTAEVVVDKKNTGQFFEVFEMGETRVDNESLKVVFDTLRLLDQFSGGLLAADPNRPKVILANDMRLETNDGGQEIKGFANRRIAFINISAVAESAKEAGSDPNEILAAVIVHEILGHSLENLVKGGTGKYFSEHFDYSDEHVKGEIFDSVHKSVEPKDKSIKNSQIVREYGGVSAAEDFATSVDTTITEALGLDNSTNKISTWKGKHDEYRRDLVMKLMDLAAKQASQYRNTPGISGSELRYLYDNKGLPVGVEPARKLEVTTISGETAIQEEIVKIIKKNRLPDEFIVKPTYGRA